MLRTPADKSKLKLGDIITLHGVAHWTVPGLVFEGKRLIPALQLLLTTYHCKQRTG